MNLALKFRPASRTVRVPPRNWGSKEDVLVWARGVLAGGPPVLVAVVSDPGAGSPRRASWKDIQSGALAGKSVEIRSDPPGLIVEDEGTGVRKFVPSASGVSFGTGVKTLSELKSTIESEKTLREFVESENSIFNKATVMTAPKERRTQLWWQHGRNINDFVRDSHGGTSRESLWQALVQWGTGMKGYGRQTHQDCCYFHEWLPSLASGDPLFLLSTTRIQHILRIGDRSSRTRNFLRRFCASRTGSSFSDDEFAWLYDQRRQGWPLDEADRVKFVAIGARLLGEVPDDIDGSDVQKEMREILARLRQSRQSVSASPRM